MRSKSVRIVIIVAFCAAATFAMAWGRMGHYYISHAAIFSLPDSMRTFFFNHADFITEESVVPDIRKYTIGDKAEFPRHYIDLEDYGPNALNSLPRSKKEADIQFTQEELTKKGTLPWTIQEIQAKLTDAFKKKNKGEIIFLASTLSHYIGDANMPLHTCANHNGQLTKQPGIHSLFEGQMMERNYKSLNVNTGAAPYFKDIEATTWKMIGESHASADSVLLKADASLRKSFPQRNLYLLDSADKVVKNMYGDWYFSKEYTDALYKKLDGLLEKRLRAAIYYTSGYWYTAWVNAGKPDLKMLDDASITKRNQKFLKMEMKLWQQGKLINLKPMPEFELIHER